MTISGAALIFINIGSHNNVECKVEKQYTDKASGKQYPSILDYTFKQDDTFVDTRYLKMNIF